MKISILFICGLLIILPVITEARTWYVKPDSTGQVINIQAGIDSCGSGDTVLVAPGIFFGEGNRDLDYKGKAIVVKSELGAEVTIIDCEHSNSRGFYFHSSEDSLSIVEGLTIQNGFVTGEIGGGAICCLSASPTIRHNVINNNASAYYGNGIYCKHSSAHIYDNIIEESFISDGLGGGIYCDSSSVVIIGNLINGNRAFYGGGIYVSNGSYEIKHNTIEHNQFENRGGGIFCKNSTAVITNNSIAYNYSFCESAFGIGGGLYLESGAFTVEDNTILNNSGHSASGIACYSFSQITQIKNNCQRSFKIEPFSVV